MTLEERQEWFIDFFQSVDTWQDRFNYLIEIGNQLPSMSEHLKNNSALISLCQSRTYFHAYNANGIITIEGWSNSAIVSGLIAMLKDIFEGWPVSELKEIAINFHISIGLMENMTLQRQATLEVMIERIKQLC